MNNRFLPRKVPANLGHLFLNMKLFCVRLVDRSFFCFVGFDSCREFLDPERSVSIASAETSGNRLLLLLGQASRVLHLTIAGEQVVPCS